LTIARKRDLPMEGRESQTNFKKNWGEFRAKPKKRSRGGSKRALNGWKETETMGLRGEDKRGENK